MKTIAACIVLVCTMIRTGFEVTQLDPPPFNIPECEGCTFVPNWPYSGDFNHDGGVDGQDVYDFYAAWEDCWPGTADLNHDGWCDHCDECYFWIGWNRGV